MNIIIVIIFLENIIISIIIVCDSDNNRIPVFDLDLNFVRSTIGSYGKGEGEFREPRDIKFDTAGNMIVSDANNFRIQVLDSSGHFIRAFGEEGKGKLESQEIFILLTSTCTYQIIVLLFMIAQVNLSPSLVAVVGRRRSFTIQWASPLFLALFTFVIKTEFSFFKDWEFNGFCKVTLLLTMTFVKYYNWCGCDFRDWILNI